MHIAICDDDSADLNSLLCCLAEYGLTGLVIHKFLGSNELIQSAKTTKFDIVFLDIEMPEPNGYETALTLKTLAPKILIIFLTNSMEYTLRGYGLAFRYLTKPIDKNLLLSALDVAIKEIRANRFLFVAEGASQILSFEEIYYIEVFNHYTVIHSVDQEYSSRMSLKDVSSQLPAGYFGMPHQSYIVNFSHVKTATATEIRLTNGSIIPISRRRQKEFAEQFYLYLGR